MYRETDAVCSEKHTNVEFLNINLVIHKAASGPYRAKIHSCWNVWSFHSVVDKQLVFLGCCLLCLLVCRTHRFFEKSFCVLLQDMTVQITKIKAVTSYKPWNLNKNVVFNLEWWWVYTNWFLINSWNLFRLSSW